MTGLFVGIDPGLDGAITLVRGVDLLEVHDMPTVTRKVGKKQRREVSPHMLHDIAVTFGPVAGCIIEGVTSSPQMGVTSAFGFGRSLGIVEAVAACCLWRTTLVAPSVWKKAVGISKDKGEARREACMLWPERSDLFARVKDDGRAEAALLAEWGRRHTS